MNTSSVRKLQKQKHGEHSKQGFVYVRDDHTGMEYATMLHHTRESTLSTKRETYSYRNPVVR